jgi:hypothetical protein
MNLKTGMAAEMFEVGSKVFVRTPTYYYLGTLLAIEESYIILTGVKWVGQTGDLNAFFSNPQKFAKEAEEYPPAIKEVKNTGFIMDICLVPTI